MIAIDNKDSKKVLKDSIAFLERQGFKNIKAHAKGYEMPKLYHKVGTSISIGPDIEAESGGAKHYFDISLRSEQPQQLKSKWRFLDTLSKMKDYHFKIITQRGHYKFTQDILDDLHLDKNPIHL